MSWCVWRKQPNWTPCPIASPTTMKPSIQKLLNASRPHLQKASAGWPQHLKTTPANLAPLPARGTLLRSDEPANPVLSAGGESCIRHNCVLAHDAGLNGFAGKLVFNGDS